MVVNLDVNVSYAELIRSNVIPKSLMSALENQLFALLLRL